jgi:hypothetical protein
MKSARRGNLESADLMRQAAHAGFGNGTLIAADRQSLQMPSLKLLAGCVSRESSRQKPVPQRG